MMILPFSIDHYYCQNHHHHSHYYLPHHHPYIVPVYLEYPDLTGKGQECAVRAMAEGFNEGVSCFQEVRL